MRWQLRRLIFGDRRATDRVVSESKQALRRLDQALSRVNLATDEHRDQRNTDDQR